MLQKMSTGKESKFKKVVRCRKRLPKSNYQRTKNQIFKSRPMLQKSCPRATKSNYKKPSEVARNCPRVTKPSFQKLSDVARELSSKLSWIAINVGVLPKWGNLKY